MPLSHKYRKRLIILAVFLVVAAAVALTMSTGAHKVWRHLLSADIVWLVLILGAQSVAYWAYVIPYKYVFKMSFKEAKKCSFEGFQPLKPGGGFVYDMALHKPLGYQARVYYLGLWEYAALAPAILVAAIVGFINASVPIQLSLPWIVGVPLGTAITLIGIAYRQKVARFPRAHRLVNLMLEMLHDQRRGELIILMIGMAFYWAGELFALWGALQLFDLNLAWTALLIAYGTGYSITRRSLPLAGAGLVLVSLAFSLHWVGAGMSLALLAALAYQVSNFLLPILFHRSVYSSNEPMAVTTAQT